MVSLNVHNCLFISVLASAIILQLPEARCSVVIEVEPEAFWNSVGEDARGDCCESLSCQLACDHQLSFCLDLHTDPINWDHSLCRIKWSLTEEYIKDNDVTFLAGDMIYVTLDSWDGSFVLKVLVEDLDLSGNDLVDEIFAVFTVPTPFSAGDALWYEEVLNGTRTAAEPTSLKLKYTVYCEKGWTGNTCEEYTVNATTIPQEDVSESTEEVNTVTYVCVGVALALVLVGAIVIGIWICYKKTKPGDEMPHDLQSTVYVTDVISEAIHNDVTSSRCDLSKV